MELKIDNRIPGLRAHTIIDRRIIASKNYSIYEFNLEDNELRFRNTLPVNQIKKFLSNSNLASKIFRLGISQIKKYQDKVLIGSNSGLYISNPAFSSFVHLDVPLRSFQLLDHNLCITPKYVYYGEYLPNLRRDQVDIFRSEDGFKWEKIHSFPSGAIKHIHALQLDPCSDRIWFSTGDKDEECIIGNANYDFSNINILGQGSQKWRTLEFLFKEKSVYWGMDSPSEESHLIKYDRRSGQISKIRMFDGPIYNLRRISADKYIIGTANENGIIELDNRAHLWFSPDLEEWYDVVSFEKNFLPYVFGFARLIFPCNLNNTIAFSLENVKDLDNSLIVGEIK